MVKADFVTGLVLIALGIATMVVSLAMPRFAELNVEPYTAPGLVPGVLGLVIPILGGVLFVRATRAGGWRLLDRPATHGWWQADAGARNLALAVLLCLAYAGRVRAVHDRLLRDHQPRVRHLGHARVRLLGFVLREMKYSMAPLVLGLVLGDILDKSLRRAWCCPTAP